jgi:hypothetical protein
LNSKPNPGNFANRPREEVKEIARKGGQKGGKIGGRARGVGGFHDMDPAKQVSTDKNSPCFPRLSLSTSPESEKNALLIPSFDFLLSNEISARSHPKVGTPRAALFRKGVKGLVKLAGKGEEDEVGTRMKRSLSSKSVNSGSWLDKTIYYDPILKDTSCESGME